MRKFIIAVFLMIGVLFIIGRFAEVEAIIKTLQQGDYRFLFLAICVQILWLINIGASYQVIYKAIGVNEKLKNLVLVAAASIFANVIAPSAGVSGTAVFLSEARWNKYSPARAAAAGAIYLEFDYLGFITIMLIGFIVLFRRNNLNFGQITASIVLMMLAGGLAFLLYLGMRSANSLSVVLVRLTNLVNRFSRPLIHREYLSSQRAHEFAHDVADGLRELSRKPASMFLPAILALTTKLLLMLNLLLIFIAFEAPISLGTVVATFSIAYLFFIVFPTPGGIGAVEGIMTLTLTSMYIPLGTAAVITLAYRGVTFWLPLFFGMLAFRWVGSEKL